VKDHTQESANPHGDSQFKPNTTVAAVVVDGDKFLLVEEIEHGKHVFNQPAGHLEANENFLSATKREVLEETGLVLSPQYCSGIYYYYRDELSLYFLRFCFVIELNAELKNVLRSQHEVNGKGELNCIPQDEEIIKTHWFTLQEIKSRQSQLRSPMVLECIEDYLKGRKIPLTSFKSNL